MIGKDGVCNSAVGDKVRVTTRDQEIKGVIRFMSRRQDVLAEAKGIKNGEK